MTEQARNPHQQTLEGKYLQEAQSFFGQSIGRVKSRIQNYHEHPWTTRLKAVAGNS